MDKRIKHGKKRYRFKKSRENNLTELYGQILMFFYKREMKKLVIFALIVVFGCSEEHEINKKICSPFRMTISDAIPVQFWVNGVETYNQKEVCGIIPTCFCQPFECDDEIRIQFQKDNDLIDGDFATNATQYSSSSIASNRANWSTSPAQVTMNAANPVITEILYIANYLPIGRTFNFDYSLGGSGNYVAGGGNALGVNITFFDASFNDLGGGSTLMSATGASKAQSGTATITVPVGAIYMGIYASAATISSGSYTITIVSLNIDLDDVYDLIIYDPLGNEIKRLDFFNLTFGTYEVAFVPSDQSICDEQIRLSIVDSGDEELATSDCLDIKTSHECTSLIRYDNAKDFAGIEYSSFSPTAEFYLRIPAIFFHERNTEEEENFEESSENIVRLRNEIKLKRLLEVGFMPDYMHRKLLLILAHDTIEIDGESWIKRDPYEKEEPTNKRYPLKKATVLLTQKDYIKRNIL